MAGIGVGGLVSLAYMLAETLRDKPRAKEKQKEVEELSPFIPTTGSPKTASNGESDTGPSFGDGLLDPIKAVFSKGLRGGIMVPAAGAAAVVPAWFAFKYLKDQYNKSRMSQLDRELEVARQDFRDALAGDTKESAAIDELIDEIKSKQADSSLGPAPSAATGSDKEPRDSDTHFGGGWGLAAGGLSMTALMAAYLSYKLLDRTMSVGHPKVQALNAMKELQKRRKSLSGVTPYVHIDQDDSGQLIPRI